MSKHKAEKTVRIASSLLVVPKKLSTIPKMAKNNLKDFVADVKADVARRKDTLDLMVSEEI